MSENSKKNQMNIFDESLIHPSIAVLHLVVPRRL